MAQRQRRFPKPVSAKQHLFSGCECVGLQGRSFDRSIVSRCRDVGQAFFAWEALIGPFSHQASRRLIAPQVCGRGLSPNGVRVLRCFSGQTRDIASPQSLFFTRLTALRIIAFFGIGGP